MNKKTVRNIDARGRRILLRSDFNVPIENGQIEDDWRITAGLPSIRFLLGQDCRLTICSHLGRPKGKAVPEFSLNPVARRLSKLLGFEVSFSADCVGDEALRLSKSLSVGEVLLLENTRFHREETENDVEFARKLSRHGEIFVDDAFATAHRSHASNVGVARILPSAAGLLMESEVDALGTAIDHFKRPLAAVFGGVKISDKLGVIKRIGKIADFLLFGGGIANTAFKTRGIEIGTSVMDKSSLKSMEELLGLFGPKIILPVDVVIREEDGFIRTCKPTEVPNNAKILDVGPMSVSNFLKTLTTCREVIWNGPLGYFETKPFDKGTLAFIQGLVSLSAKTYAGGGDTEHALAKAGLRDRLTCVSTGGGAFLDFLAGKELPALEVLPERGERAA